MFKIAQEEGISDGYSLHPTMQLRLAYEKDSWMKITLDIQVFREITLS